MRQSNCSLDYAIAALKRAGYDIDKQLVRETIEEIVNGMTRYPVFEEPLPKELIDDERIHPPEDGEKETAE